MIIGNVLADGSYSTGDYTVTLVYSCNHWRVLTKEEIEQITRTHSFRPFTECNQCEEISDEEFWRAARKAGQR